MIAKDMSWFTDELFPVVKKYSGIGDITIENEKDT